MDQDEARAREVANTYACKIAAYAHRTGLLSLPETAAEWNKRRDGFVRRHWREFLYLDPAELSAR